MRWESLGGLWEGATDLVKDRLQPIHHDAGHLIILTFHRVDSLKVAEDELRRLRTTAVPVSLDRVLAANAGEDELPPGAVLLTLDDGHPSVVDAAPIFADLEIPAVCFVISDVIDTTTPFWWDEVEGLTDRGARAEGFDGATGLDLVNTLKRVPDPRRRQVIEELRSQVATPVETRQMTRTDLHTLEAAGITVGGHTASHPILPMCDVPTLDHELESCRDRLDELLGYPPRSVAYPSGGVDDRVVAAVQRAGWEVGFTWNHAVSPFPFPDPYRIDRVKTNLGSGRSRLSLLGTGRHRSLRQAPRQAAATACP